MKVSEIMSVGVQSVRPGTPAANARERMRTKKIHHLLVQEGTELVGVLSSRDFVRRGRTGGKAPTPSVADVMTAPVVTVDKDASVHRTANVMRGHSIGCVIVVDRGRPVGIVTLSDVLRQVGQTPRHRRDSQAPPDLNFRVPHKKQHRPGRAW